MLRLVSIFLPLALLPIAFALYASEPDVVPLTAANFQDRVIKSDDVWLVEFFAPWCGHCKALAPAWVKAAKALKGFVKVGAVDMDQHQSVGAPYGVKGFPTIKIFGANKNAPTDYQQGRDEQSIAQAGIQAAAEIVQARLGGGGGSGGGGGASEVVTLTDSNFDGKVLKSKDTWLVAFIAPWCGHCKNLHPEWERAAREMKGKPIHIARVDATAQQALGQRFKVEGFPTIKVFKNGTPEDYNGGRSASDIIQFCDNMLESMLPPPEVKQITSSDVFTEHCSSKALCLVAFFPGLDAYSNAKTRNGFIDILKKLTTKQTLKKFGFVWTEAMAQPELEKAFSIGDYPALAAINGKKLKWTTMRGAFSETELSGFLGRLMSAREATSSLSKLPEIKKVGEWDGKDAIVAAQEEEMSLDDIMNEKLDS